MNFRPSRPEDQERLFNIWHAAVVATHDFLSEQDLKEIAEAVKTHYLPNAILQVFVDDHDGPIGFMGCTDNNIDALFVDPDSHGKGVGTRFIDLMKAKYDLVTVQVNEQQPQAHAFYQRCGFVDVRRDPTDDEGRPFPIVHLEWRKETGQLQED